MADDGAFNPAARAAIYETTGHRCAGCGRPDLTCQHRRPRGMGGTSLVSIGHPANGVPLCGSGTTGCHGWAERHPGLALLLGWRLAPHQPALGTPWWSRHGWWSWAEEPDGFVYVTWVDDEELDDQAPRADAVARFRRWRTPPPEPGLAKSRSGSISVTGRILA